MRFHAETIQQVKEQARIDDVISGLIHLKRSGKSLIGVCPFHDDHHPSLNVYGDKGFYICRSCGAKGDVIQFVQEFERKSFSDAVLDLAQRYSVPLKTADPEEQEKFERTLTFRERLYEVIAVTASHYQHNLKTPLGRDALAYLRDRAISDESITSFRLGYSIGGWDTLFNYLKQRGFTQEEILGAGLIKPKADGGFYDTFRNRLMVPICDQQGRVIGFGARTLSDERPKYLNSPETELFHKEKSLFGLDKAFSSIGKEKSAVIVEGYFDVIGLHQEGIMHAVACQGIALSDTVVRTLKRHADRIILSFDPDEAGQKAIERILSTNVGLVDIDVIRLPKGKDPDQLVRDEGVAAYRQRLLDAEDGISWLFEEIVNRYDLADARQRSKASVELVAFLLQLEPVAQAQYLELAAEKLSQGNHGMVMPNLTALKARMGMVRATLPDKVPLPELSGVEKAERLLLRNYIQDYYKPQILEGIESREIKFHSPNLARVWSALSKYPTETLVPLSEVTEALDDIWKDILFLLEPLPEYGVPPIQIEEALTVLEREHWQAQLEQAEQDWLVAENRSESIEAQDRMNRAIRKIKTLQLKAID